MYIFGDKSCVVCLANSRDYQASKRNPKLGLLSGVKLLFTKKFVQIRRIDSSLFKASLVCYWAHDLATPIDEGLTVLEAVVQVEKSMAYSVAMEEVLDEELGEDNIKG